MDHSLVLLLIIGHAKQDVVTQGQVLHPRCLRDVGDGAANIDPALLHTHLGQDSLQDAALACRVGSICNNLSELPAATIVNGHWPHQAGDVLG